MRDSLTDLLGDLMAIVVLPYLGSAAAARAGPRVTRDSQLPRAPAACS
jgi:hypothetical protein